MEMSNIAVGFKSHISHRHHNAIIRSGKALCSPSKGTVTNRSYPFKFLIVFDKTKNFLLWQDTDIGSDSVHDNPFTSLF
jgi:hypothetical protein